MTKTIEGFVVIDHDDNGNIHSATVFADKAEAFDRAYELVKSHVAEEDPDFADEVDEAIERMAKDGRWFGYSAAAVTVQKAEAGNE